MVQEALSDLLAEGLGIDGNPAVPYEDFMDEYVRFASLSPNERASPPLESFDASIRVRAIERLVSTLLAAVDQLETHREPSEENTAELTSRSSSPASLSDSTTCPATRWKHTS